MARIRTRSIVVIGATLPPLWVVGCAAVAGLDAYDVVDCLGVCEGGSGVDAADETIGSSANDGSVPDGAPIPPDRATDAGRCTECPPSVARQACVDETCVPSRRVFLTSSGSTASLGGTNGADARCQNLATDAGLGGSWRAWLSQRGDSPSERFTRFDGGYRLLDGTLVATSWADLTDGTLARPINLDERGARAPAVEVWTGTTVSGESSGQRCVGFGSASPGAPPADVGIADRWDGGWTEAYEQVCSRTDPRIYCFEQ
jgi:hypothetical protein